MRNEKKGINARQRSNCGVGVLMDMSGEKSHEIVQDSLDIVENLDHRGARGAEENTGDGAGILIQKPHRFFVEAVEKLNEHGLGFDDYGVGQMFLPRDDEAREEVVEAVEEAVRDEGFEVVAWRNVPTENDGLGESALETEPDIRQVFVTHEDNVTGEELDSALYVLRRVIEKRAGDVHDRFYVCSLDRRKVVYKGLLTNAQVRMYFEDLNDERVESSLALVHSRFSTNTLGAWELAHPFRNIIHNGEINTLRGNLNWMFTREADLESEKFGDDIEKLKPVTKEDQSDTAVVDNVLELLVESGRDLPHALRMLIPEAWNKDETIDEERRDWYDYHSTIMEPWDGPALVAFTDGYSVGAVLDRNGLRPCRYTVTKNDRLIMASETGVMETPPDEVRKKGRLQPGQMFYADPEEGRIVPDEKVFDELTDEKYGEWLEENRVRLDEFADHDPEPTETVRDEIDDYHRAFGYTGDLVEKMFKPMSVEGHDPVGSMGDDTPPAALSDRNRALFDYFKQLFAQVSNPPIDHLREDLVTSLESHIGRQRNTLGETPEHCKQVKLESPVLTDGELDALASMDKNSVRAKTLDITYEKGEKTLKEAVEDVRAEATEAVEEGYEIIVLSDRATDDDRVPIPSLLAVGGVHHHLIREGTRTDTGLVLESGQPFLVHHFCTLIGYGADAVNPYLAYETITEFGREGELSLTESWREEEPTATPEEAVDRYVEAVEEGVLKVMSKMGISTLESYKGAQIFEAVGLKSEFVEEYFYGTTARTEGVGIEGVEKDLLERHDFGFETETNELDPGGEIEWTRNGEFHAWKSGTVRKLQAAVREDDYETYKEFSRTMKHDNESLHELRGLLELDSDRESVPVEEVEHVDEIVQRFFTGSMSFGSLSKEAHETLAEAMNRIGAKSGSGEGGEPVERFGTERRSKIKQVASGRFGVTVSYLNDAEHIEIKMAQGSKPGEGGHLPGHKVNETIASTRHTTEGVALISPPPQHDIYSIEDLAQLIHDLKCSNPDADVHVKLVAEDGVGVIAAGVSKARADSVLISGHAGGTGASPRTSIKSAGLPWELGIAEAHQVLMENDLRSRIRVRVDGGMKTGRDIVVAALLGAEEYGFGTAALVSEGCVMVRKCHTNKCPTGIATQDEERRQLFRGEVEHVVNYMEFMAQEVREYMSELGFRTMDEMIGAVKALEQREVDHPKASGIDLSRLMRKPDSDDDPVKTREQNHRLDDKIDHELIGAARRAIEDGEPVEVSREIRNRDRTTGAMLSSEIAKVHGENGLPDDTVKLDFEGSAGQSFGAFAVNGMTMRVVGDANDYVGKGLSGGKIIIKTPDDAAYEEDENILIGNVALYGATDGEAYFNGVAGERFGVRNSGVKTVVEGVGDHGCEYMTGGVAVVLGETGKNFGAGMSGGEAYVLDEIGDFEDVRLNDDMIHVEPMDERDERLVRRMVENHRDYTGSEKAKEVLENWDEYVDSFVKIMPDPYARVVEKRMKEGEDIRVSPPPEASAGAATDGGESETADD